MEQRFSAEIQAVARETEKGIGDKTFGDAREFVSALGTEAAGDVRPFLESAAGSTDLKTAEAAKRMLARLDIEKL